MGEDQEAEKCYLKSYSLVLKEGVNLENVAWNYFHLADVAQFRSQWEDAMEKFSKSQDAFRKLGNRLGQVAALTHLGEIACAQNKLDQAESHFQSAVQLSLAEKSKPLLVNLVAGLAQLLKEQGDEKTAIGLLMMALTHPTCRQQTKDRAVSLALDLKSKFSAEEVEGILHWAKASSIEEVAAHWLVSGKPISSRNQGKRKKSKSPRQSKRKKSIKRLIRSKPVGKKRKKSRG
jgi:tetratricopeptide (TPR) repeat protein